MLRTFITFIKKLKARRIEQKIVEQEFIINRRQAGAEAARERGYSVWANQLTDEMWAAHTQVVKLKTYLRSLATPS